MNHFLSEFSPQVQAEIVRAISSILIAVIGVIAGGLMVFFAKLKYRRVRETQNGRRTTVFEFEGGFKKK